MKQRMPVFSEWESGNLKTLLVLPTGCGKTIVFAKITEECVRRGDRVLILAHRGELLDQAADKIQKATGLNSSVEKAEQSCIGSWNRVVVGSVQTLMREKRLSNLTAIISTQSLLMKHITQSATAISVCLSILTMQKCWVLPQHPTEEI